MTDSGFINKREFTESQEDLLRELAPHLEFMEYVYDSFLNMFLTNGYAIEESENSASVGAVMSGIYASRGTEQVVAVPDDLWVAKEFFRISISVRKMMKFGVIKGHQEGVDEFGWPAFVIEDVKPLSEFTQGEVT